MKSVSMAFLHSYLSEVWELARHQPVVVDSHTGPDFVILSAAEYERLTGTAITSDVTHTIDQPIDPLSIRPTPGVTVYKKR